MVGSLGFYILAAAFQPCNAVTPGESSYEKIQIEPHGHLISVGGIATSFAIDDHQSSASLLPAENAIRPAHGADDVDLKAASLVRREAKRFTTKHRHRTMTERRIWAKKHGNLFATHRVMARALASSGLYSINVPTIISSSAIVYVASFFLVAGCLFSLCQCVAQLRERGSAQGADGAVDNPDGGSGGSGENAASPPVEHDFHRSPEGLDEDIYGMGIAALIRDTQRFALGTECLALRLSRLLLSLLTLLFTMCLQVFLLYEMKRLVTSVSSNEAQDTYESYEVWMYGNDKSKMTKLPDGDVRGKPENFDISRFDGLADELKDAICQVPLSQPTFFIALLLVWTLVCFSEMRHSFDIGGSILVSTPTISTMKEALQETEEEDDEAVIVVGLTPLVKVIALCFIIIPRVLVSFTLLWLGCRWLTGTFGFSDVLQNAVALEFILLLKDIFYKTVTPAHNKKETVNTLIRPFVENERPTSSVFLGAFTWGVLAMIWVLLYITSFQRVLPDYQWDVNAACASYLASVETATPGS